MNKNLFRMTGYLGAQESYADAKAVLVGVPLDLTVSNRPGSRTGPQQIRTVSYALEEYSIYQDLSLDDLCFYDAGDIVLPHGNVSESLRLIEKVAGQIFTDRKLPVFLGGEHLVSYPLIKSCFEKYPELVVLHFDAHADLREEYGGESDSHATVMHKVVGMLGKRRVFQFGIRSGTKGEFAFASDNTQMFKDEIFPALNNVITELKDKPVYITLDIDVVDPAFAPGTGTPEPGGCASREILTAIRAMKQLDVVGLDIVEVSPVYDNSEITAMLAAKLVRESLLAFVKK
jgi:agmatinase